MLPLEKAAILVEALPYIKEFYGRTVVIKFGGHAMLDADLKKAIVQDFVLMKFVGMHPVVVHGGGPEITDMLARLGKKSDFIRGQRVTDLETMEVVEMVLAGKINKEIVARIHCLGGKALGLSGQDGRLIEAKKKVISACNVDGEEEQMDLGYVGEVTGINPEIVQTVIHKGYIPVVAPLGVGENGETYNINADYVAGELAAALHADKLVLLTDVEGLMACPGEPSSLISSVHAGQVPRMIAEGVVQGGMIPKVECCCQALAGGVTRTHIIDGRIPHSILLEVFTREGIGTMVVPD